MSRFHSYITTATKIIESYDGSQPFGSHLKKFFSLEKKYGSRDRKTIATLCYSYFRIGHALKNTDLPEKILSGYFLCENKNNELLAALRPEWNEQVCLPVSEKLRFLQIGPLDFFPFTNELSNDIDKAGFSISFLKQPHFYLRIRPGKRDIVLDKLNNAGLSFETTGECTLQLPNNTALDDFIKINKEAVVQDFSSQQVLDFLIKPGHHFAGKNKIKAWDCCAASGGKSILLYDILKRKVQLTVSDIRKNILVNLETRLQQAGVNIHKKFIADLSNDTTLLPGDLFEIIICDVPCTGSGTWARTPEQLFYFKKEATDIYAEKQKKIVSSVIPHLQPDGLLFYITCSVFKKENEGIVEFIKEKFHLQLLQMQYLEGYDKKADTMFVAVFGAPLLP